MEGMAIDAIGDGFVARCQKIYVAEGFSNPILSIGKDIYCDTDLAIPKLETFFPPSSRYPDLNPSTTEGKALETMLATWVESQVWKYAVYAIPAAWKPCSRTSNFLEDRTKCFGRKWSKENQDKLRIKSDYVMRSNFEFLETTLLSGSRKWFLGDTISLANVYIGFIYD